MRKMKVGFIGLGLMRNPMVRKFYKQALLSNLGDQDLPAVLEVLKKIKNS